MDILFFSDTHSMHDNLKTFKPPYLATIKDFILIHSGDITEDGTEAETNDFLRWFAKLPCKHKIFVGGNHDLFLETCTPTQLRKLIPAGVTYLNNSGITINGFNIWGSPTTPYFLGMAFNKKCGTAIRQIWNKIPSKTDILITHGPPKNILDGGIGCEDLLNRVAVVKPRFHLFGHAHEQAGMLETYDTTFVNHALANNRDPLKNRPYKMLQEPICLSIKIGKVNTLQTGMPKTE